MITSFCNNNTGFSIISIAQCLRLASLIRVLYKICIIIIIITNNKYAIIGYRDPVSEFSELSNFSISLS